MTYSSGETGNVAGTKDQGLGSSTRPSSLRGTLAAGGAAPQATRLWHSLLGRGSHLTGG